MIGLTASRGCNEEARVQSSVLRCPEAAAEIKFQVEWSFLSLASLLVVDQCSRNVLFDGRDVMLVLAADRPVIMSRKNKLSCRVEG